MGHLGPILGHLRPILEPSWVHLAFIKGSGLEPHIADFEEWSAAGGSPQGAQSGRPSASAEARAVSDVLVKFFLVSKTFQKGSQGSPSRRGRLGAPSMLRSKIGLKPCKNHGFYDIFAMSPILKLSSSIFLELTPMLGQLGAILGSSWAIFGRKIASR